MPTTAAAATETFHRFEAVATANYTVVDGATLVDGSTSNAEIESLEDQP